MLRRITGHFGSSSYRRGVSVVCIRRDRNPEVAFCFIKCRTPYVIRYIGMLSAPPELVTRFPLVVSSPLNPLSTRHPSELLSSSGTKIASAAVPADSSDPTMGPTISIIDPDRLSTALSRSSARGRSTRAPLGHYRAKLRYTFAKLAIDRLPRDTYEISDRGRSRARSTTRDCAENNSIRSLATIIIFLDVKLRRDDQSRPRL